MSTSIIDRIESENAHAAVAARKQFNELAGRIARGEEPGKADVIRVTAEAGKTLDDLRKAVEAIRERMELQQAVTRHKAAGDELKLIDQELLSLESEFQALVEAHNRRVEPVIARRDAALKVQMADSGAQGKLQRGAAEWAQAENAAASSAVAKAHSRIRQQDQRIRGHRDTIERYTRAIDELKGDRLLPADRDRRIAENRGVIANAEREIVFSERELESLELQMVGLQAEADRTFELLLDPLSV